MGSSFRVIIITGALFVLGAYVLAGFFVYKNDLKLVDSRNWVIHTHKVMMQLRELLSTVKDCETGQRGYLITGDPSYLQPYEKGLSKIDTLTDELQILLGENKVQQEELKRVKPIITSKISELKQSVKVRSEKGFEPASAIVKTNLGKSTMDNIRASIERMESTEQNLLVSRLDRLTQESNIARVYSACLMGASYALIGVMLALIGRLLARVEQKAEALKESELRYDLAIKGSYEGIWDWNLVTNESFYSRRCKEQLGYAENEIDPKKIHLLKSYVHPDDQKIVMDALRAHLRDKVPYDIQCRLRCKDDTYRWIHCRGQAIWDEAGRPVRMAGSHQDITDRIEKEQLLRHSERRFRAIFDQTFQFIGILSPEGILLEGNRSALDFEGVESSDVFGHPFWETPWWSHSKETQEKLKRAIKEAAEGNFVRFETEHVGKTGTIHVDFSIKPVFDDAGKVLMLIPEGRDISERIRAESALAEREARTRVILDTAAEGIITITDPEQGVIESANNAAHEMFGYGRGGLIGLRVSEIVPDYLKLVQDITKAQEDSGLAGSSIEANGRRADGTTLPIEIASSVCRVGQQQIFTGIVRDVSERKEVERRVREFYSMVSHELRTPLTSIRGSLSLMEGGRTGDLPPRAMQLVKVAHAESERLIRLINDILDIRKIEAGKLDLKIVEVELAQLINMSLEAIQSMAGDANVKLVSKINTTGKLNCDKDKITQVITNLLSNAIKFSPEHGQVALSVDKTPKNFYRFSISDAGPGIPDIEKPRLFGLFQQLDLSDSRPKGGTGLGLAICKGIVEQHSGTIGVESVVGEGSTFWFELPDLVALLPVPAITQRMPAAHKALLVDDDEKLCQVLRVMLEDQGFVVMRAGTVKEAETCLEMDGNPDVIILDIWLPDGNGLELMDKLGQDERTEQIPIIILSGKEPDQDYYVNPLLIDWIQKPYEEKRLISALRTAVRRRVSGPARVLVVEDHQPTRELIKQELESMRVDCIEAADGITAIHLARTSDPDLIVLDLAMPGLNGFEVVRVLRKEHCQKIPLIVYTARDLTDDDKRNLTLGLTTHLIKSRTTEGELLDAVRSLLNGLVSEPIAKAQSKE